MFQFYHLCFYSDKGDYLSELRFFIPNNDANEKDSSKKDDEEKEQEDEEEEKGEIKEEEVSIAHF